MKKLSDKARMYARSYGHPLYGREIEGTAELLLQIADRLDEYENLEEQGKLLRLPCALGDTVYMVDAYIDIRGVPAWRKDFGELRYRIIESKFRLKDVGLIGKTVFLTYDEAKTALKERSE